MKALLEQIGANEASPENVAKVNENIAEVAKVVSTVEVAISDGLQWSDVSVIGKIVPDVMRMAAGFKDYGGLARRDFVIEVVWLVYRLVDTFPDGKRNNINIPFLAGSFERRMERAVVAFAAGMAVDGLYGRMKDDGEV